MAKDDEGGKVLTFRNPDGKPIAVPEEIVLEAERPYRAFKLHQQGLEWDLIATREGYPTPGAAEYDVRRYLREGKALVNDYTRREMLALEVARLNALQAKAWPQAMEGHLPSMMFCSDQIMRRIKVLKLDETQEGEEELSGPRTVVVQVDPDDYTRTLTEIVNAE